MKTHFFFDMDGTLAKFYADRYCLKRALAGVPGFYAGLQPYSGMVGAVKMLIETQDASVSIVTAVPDNRLRGMVIAEKTEWLKQQGIDPETVIITDCGDSKSEAVRDRLGFFDRTCILVDDYSFNLKEWEENGGTSIKALNEVNGYGWNGHYFDGCMVNAESDADAIYHVLMEVCKCLGKE